MRLLFQKLLYFLPSRNRGRGPGPGDRQGGSGGGLLQAHAQVLALAQAGQEVAGEGVPGGGGVHGGDGEGLLHVVAPVGPAQDPLLPQGEDDGGAGIGPA